MACSSKIWESHGNVCKDEVFSHISMFPRSLVKRKTSILISYALEVRDEEDNVMLWEPSGGEDAPLNNEDWPVTSGHRYLSHGIEFGIEEYNKSLLIN